MEIAEKIKEIPPQKARVLVWITIVAVSLLIAIIYDFRQEKTDQGQQVQNDELPLDTVIPQGWTIVPIKVKNSESLDSILGPYGLVSLFASPGHPDARPRLIVKRVKIVRSPRNPSHFSVLAPENEAHHVVAVKGAFYVTVLNPEYSGTIFEKPKVARKHHLIVDEGSSNNEK